MDNRKVMVSVEINAWNASSLAAIAKLLDGEEGLMDLVGQDALEGLSAIASFLAEEGCDSVEQKAMVGQIIELLNEVLER